jgi:hypothetical protein
LKRKPQPNKTVVPNDDVLIDSFRKKAIKSRKYFQTLNVERKRFFAGEGEEFIIRVMWGMRLQLEVTRIVSEAIDDFSRVQDKSKLRARPKP